MASDAEVPWYGSDLPGILGESEGIVMEILASVTIDRAPSEVFFWLENPERAMEWQTEVSGGEILEKVPGWVGTEFVEYVGESGRGTELHGTVTEFEENRCMAFHLEGDFNQVDVRFTLEDLDGATRFTQAAEVRFKGLLRVATWFAGPLFRRRIRSQSQGELLKLKELCEQV